MLLGQQGERVDVDALGWDVGVVLVGLHQVEVGSRAGAEPVVAVELQLGLGDGVGTDVDQVALANQRASVCSGQQVLPSSGVLGGGIGVRSVGEIEPLLSKCRSTSVDQESWLHSPDQLLAWVVEVQLDLVRCIVGALHTRVLQLGYQIFVRNLRKTPALLRIQIDIVYVERRVWEGYAAHNALLGGPGAGGGGLVSGPVAVGGGGKLQIDLDLVVLEGDEGQGEAGVVAEPELQGDVQGLAGEDLGAGVAVGGGGDGGEVGGVADHGGVSGGVPSGLGQLVPNVQPGGVVLVDALATDLELYALDEDVAEPVEPPKSVASVAAGGGDGDGWEVDLEIGAMDQVTIAGNGAGDLFAEIGRAVESLLNGLEACGSVPAIN